MIRKLKTGECRLHSRKVNAETDRRRNFDAFGTREAAQKLEREVQYVKRAH